MKLKLLLFFFFVLSGAMSLFAQDTIKYLVISETRIDDSHTSYVELCNMSETEAINLSEFEFGGIDAWTQPYRPGADRRMMLPNKILWPGETFLIVNIWNLPTDMLASDPERWAGRLRIPNDMWRLADLQVHQPETEWGQFGKLDSISPTGSFSLDTWSGRSAFYIRQHLSDIDSVVIDAVNCNFSQSDGTLPDGGNTAVAGVTGATNNSVLVRKFSVKEGNTDWAKQAGIDISDSQWLPLPEWESSWGLEGVKTKVYWTVKTHGDFHLTESEVVSNTVDINFTDSTMVVPWGARRGGKIMDQFDRSLRNPSDPLDFRRRGDGLAWGYRWSGNREDSAFQSVRTGDVLILYAVGNTLEKMEFKLTLTEPTDDANMVVPKNSLRTSAAWTYNTGSVFNVTYDVPGMDTIYNIGYSTRIDTLFKYLEKAPQASWEVIYKDGNVRPDARDGDLLKVTAKNGAVKQYYIKVNEFVPNHEPYLSAITWPDMPVDFAEIADLYGWVGDTIPKFSSSVYSYSMLVPVGTDGIPALVPKKQNVDTKVTVERAKNLTGSAADRTIKFKTAAEDDTTLATYSVTLEAEKAPEDIQPFIAEPFISQHSCRASWGPSGWEICNPGNQPLDLSSYMFYRAGNQGSPAAAIQAGLATTSYGSRYNRYVPGRKWTGVQAEWEVQPGMLIQESNINPVVEGGDVFVIASVTISQVPAGAARNSFHVDFNRNANPWGETLGGDPSIGWFGDTWYLFKILNDSVRDGLKWVGDPNDFEVLDVFGTGDGTSYVVGGKNGDQLNTYWRKPHINKGNPVYKGSFGTNWDNSEWLFADRAYWGKLGYPYPTDVYMTLSGLGTHAMDPITFYKSTITSNLYKATVGYKMTEEIKGIVTGTTVDAFLSAINKDDPGQTLTVKSGSTVVTGTTAVKDGDILEVLSADGKNTSAYIIDVTAGGLSHNALLTSTVYTVGVTGATGTVSGFPFGTELKTVADNVVVPAGASFTVIDDKNAYVPYMMQNYDTAYVAVKVNDKTFFEVVAEDGNTKIVYQLKPTTATSDAFILSSLFAVDQTVATISFVPRSMNTRSFLSNLIAAPGATFKLVDKNGFDRTDGNIYQDDKVVVTAADGIHTKTYFLSMLDTYYGDQTKYLAYVQSSTYDVNQVTLDIKFVGSAATMPRQTFINNLVPALGASIVVVTANGVENTGTYLANGNKLKVTAADGATVVYYKISPSTSANELTNSAIKLYPNPTTGTVNINGIDSGKRIRVYNAMGLTVRDVVSSSNNAVISLNDEPAGMYLINIQDAGSFKIVKK